MKLRADECARSSASCPSDGKEPDGTSCGSDKVCDHGSCEAEYAAVMAACPWEEDTTGGESSTSEGGSTNGEYDASSTELPRWLTPLDRSRPVCLRLLVHAEPIFSEVGTEQLDCVGPISNPCVRRGA